VQWHVSGEGFTWETQNRARDVATAEAAWEQARAFLRDPAIGLVVLDELNIALKYHYLDVANVIADLAARPTMQHVIVTGRAAPPELVEAADTVTDMNMVKHAFKAGVKAMPGLEW
jgi:cob(I)alamin adenosyltransferase